MLERVDSPIFECVDFWTFSTKENFTSKLTESTTADNMEILFVTIAFDNNKVIGKSILSENFPPFKFSIYFSLKFTTKSERRKSLSFPNVN